MPKNIWIDCNGKNYITSIDVEAWRIIEDQEKVATRKLVDSLDEVVILEELLELNKPEIKPDLLGLHPLLYTPFRYPPLPRGSRFGSNIERGLWYGSLKIQTAMAEKAYYQLNFLRASEGNFGNIPTNFKIFSAKIKTSRGIDLTKMPFSQFTPTISSPSSYNQSQSLGAAMRNDRVESFYYVSARDPDRGVNVGVFSPKVFLKKEPNDNSFQSWICIINKNAVEFIRSNALNENAFVFPVECFMVKGELPFPAC